MASNPTPEDDEILIAVAEDIADGCHTHEATIGIKQNTEAVLRTTIAAVVNGKSALGAAEQLTTTTKAARDATDLAGKEVLKNCRLRMAKLHGPQFSPGWQEAGWPNDSTAIPESRDQRFTLLGTQRNYFTNHPTAESAEADATAAICAAAHTTVSDARAALNAAEAANTEARRTLAAAIKTLRKRVRGFIDEVGTLIADDDVRYEAFGLNIPAQATAPEGIEELTLTALGNGKVHVQWSYATRMTGARVLRKLPGPDEVFASMGTSAGLEKVLTAQPVGVLIEIQVVPYNDGGDGAASPVKSITVT